jgi:antitoxin component of MazEF toxin-antitoxin module
MEWAAFFQPSAGVSFDEALNESLLMANSFVFADYPADGQLQLAEDEMPIRFDAVVITCYNSRMKLALRRIGNSLGVIVPKEALQNWGVGEGDYLELGERGIHPFLKTQLSHEVLDELKRLLSLAVVRRCTPREIRAQSLANLYRWKRQGTWGPAYDEWTKILRRGSDGELFAAMLGRDDQSNRLRQSMPYVGLLPKEEVKKINEEAGA